jgi:hypothetical protein
MSEDATALFLLIASAWFWTDILLIQILLAVRKE